MAELGPYIAAIGLEGPRLSRAVLCRAEILDRRALHLASPTTKGLPSSSRSTGQESILRPASQLVVNALGSLDVDDILDEGPDMVNAQADILRDSDAGLAVCRKNADAAASPSRQGAA